MQHIKGWDVLIRNPPWLSTISVHLSSSLHFSGPGAAREYFKAEGINATTILTVYAVLLISSHFFRSSIMHFITQFLLPILVLAVSPALSAPILPNVDSLEARSIGYSSVDKRFIPDPAAAVTIRSQRDIIATSNQLNHQLLQPQHHSPAVKKHGVEAPLIFSPDGRDSPHSVVPRYPVKQPKPANPAANEKAEQLSRRATGSETTDGEKRERVLGRVVKLGKKLARLFYHPHHAGTSRAKHTTHRKAKDEDDD